jgi:hypothetical protein
MRQQSTSVHCGVEVLVDPRTQMLHERSFSLSVVEEEERQASGPALLPAPMSVRVNAFRNYGPKKLMTRLRRSS